MKIEIIDTKPVSANTDILTVRREDGKTATITWDKSTGCVYGPPPSGPGNESVEASYARGKTESAINAVAAWE